MDVISFKDIVSLFNSEEWDFSYLDYEEIMEVLNFPLKLGVNHLERLVFQKNDIPITAKCIVIVKHTIDYDYSLNTLFQDICINKFPNINISEFWCNYKYAVVKAGMGQYAKNSLVYHPKFFFDTHFSAFLIFNPLSDLPKRHESDFSLLKQCINCEDCVQACPVQAIHYNNKSNYSWIDMDKCDNFCFFGNHPDIPSIKNNHKLLQNLLPEEKEQIHSHCDLADLYPGLILNNYFEDNSGKVYSIQYPTCRECTSQKRCSRYGGIYPYEAAKPHIIIQ